MTGPEHYREAERLVELAGKAHLKLNQESYGNMPGHAASALIANVIAGQAQVHATLALAAATATAHFDGMGLDLANEWYKATAPERAAS